MVGLSRFLRVLARTRMGTARLSGTHWETVLGTAFWVVERYRSHDEAMVC